MIWDTVLNETNAAYVAEMLEEERAAEENRAAKEEDRAGTEESRAGKETRRRKKWLIPAAACLILGVLIWGVAGGLFGRLAGKTWDQWNSYMHPPVSEQAVGLLVEHRARIADGPYREYRPVHVCEEDQVGEKLGDVTVNAAWVYVSTEGKPLREPDPDRITTLRAEAYAIRNVSPETAVCLKYLDVTDALTLDHYYTFIDPAAEFAGPAEFFAAINADETLPPSGVTYGVLLESAKWNDIRIEQYTLDADAAAALRGKLLSLRGTVSQDPEEEMYASCEKRWVFQLDLSNGLSGRTYLLSSGYLAFYPDNLWGEGAQIFRIDRSAAADIIRLIEERGTLDVVDPYATIIATTGTDIEMTPE